MANATVLSNNFVAIILSVLFDISPLCVSSVNMAQTRKHLHALAILKVKMLIFLQESGPRCTTCIVHTPPRDSMIQFNCFQDFLQIKIINLLPIDPLFRLQPGKTAMEHLLSRGQFFGRNHEYHLMILPPCMLFFIKPVPRRLILPNRRIAGPLAVCSLFHAF